MTIVQIVLVLIAVGIILWLINNFIPMDIKVKKIINALVIIVIIIWLLKISGLLAILNKIQI